MTHCSAHIPLPLLYGCSPLPLHTQLRGRPQAQQDHALCGQDRQVQVLPEGYRDRVHQEEDGGGGQHASATHRGGAGVSRDSCCQHTTAPYRQDMVSSCPRSWFLWIQHLGPLCWIKFARHFEHWSAQATWRISGLSLPESLAFIIMFERSRLSH